MALVLVSGAIANGGPEGPAIRRELQRVYSRPEFNPDEDDLWAWLRNALLWFFHWLGTLHDTLPLLFWLLVLGCFLLLGLLVFHITWTIVRAIHAGRRAGMAGADAEERRRRSAAYRQEAESSAAAGNFTEAVRLLFLSLVYAFDEAGRLLFRPALTNREYLNLFADRPAVEQNLRVFVDLLDANWYGERPTAGAEYASCRTLYDRVSRQG